MESFKNRMSAEPEVLTKDSGPGPGEPPAEPPGEAQGVNPSGLCARLVFAEYCFAVGPFPPNYMNRTTNHCPDPSTSFPRSTNQRTLTELPTRETAISQFAALISISCLSTRSAGSDANQTLSGCRGLPSGF